MPVVAGAALGLVATRWLGAIIESRLYGVDARGPFALAAAVITVALAATRAAYLSARRASRVDPVD